MANRNKNNYIDKERLLNAYINWKETGDRKEYEYIGKVIVAIANNIISSKNFSKYNYKDEMLSYAYYCCIKSLNKINLSKSNNIFSYFSQICFMAFRFIINKENKIKSRLKLIRLDLED